MSHSQSFLNFLVAYYPPAFGKADLYDNHFIDTVENVTCSYPQEHFNSPGEFNYFVVSKVFQQLSMTNSFKGSTHTDSQIDFVISKASFAPSLPSDYVALFIELLQTMKIVNGLSF